MNVIEIRGLCKAYDGFLLDHVSLSLPSGCIMGLVGENGAGKSTMIKLILNMIRRDSGTITLFGRDNREQAELTKEDIGVVLDEVGISDCLTAMQVGKVMRNIFRNWDDAAYKKYLHMLAVPETKRFKEFSRGMKMKLGIAVALSHHPKLLIMDEATSGLDPVVRDEVTDLLLEFTRDETHSVLISSHIVSDLEKTCDYIAFLHQGKLLLCEEKDVLKETYGMVHCTGAQLEELALDAVVGKRESSYGVEAMVFRNRIPAGWEVSPIDIEQLFIFIVKGGQTA